MMISPETYRKHELDGKSPEEILEKIRELEQEIKDLKETMAAPGYSGSGIFPDDKTVLACTKEYLKEAKKAYKEAEGGA